MKATQIHSHSDFLCSTCMAAAASVHQSTTATIHYPIQNLNGGPILKILENIIQRCGDVGTCECQVGISCLCTRIM